MRECDTSSCCRVREADVAQMVEQRHGKAQAVGSSPTIGSSFVEKDTEAPRAWDALRAFH